MRFHVECRCAFAILYHEKCSILLSSEKFTAHVLNCHWLVSLTCPSSLLCCCCFSCCCYCCHCWWHCPSRQSNAAFAAIITRLQESPKCQRLPFMSFLLLPFQRITRIKMLIEVSCIWGGVQSGAGSAYKPATANYLSGVIEAIHHGEQGGGDFISLWKHANRFLYINREIKNLFLWD